MLNVQLHLDFPNQKDFTFYLSAAPATAHKNKEIIVWGQSRSQILREAMPGGKKISLGS